MVNCEIKSGKEYAAKKMRKLVEILFRSIKLENRKMKELKPKDL